VVVDQFPLRLLEAGKPWYTEGFARLTGPESWAGVAKYAHAITFTCPGHATLSTGAAPSVHGIASNDWMVEAKEGEVFTPVVGRTAEYRNEYCVPDGNLANLKAEPLGDVVKEAGGKVVALSLKDRGAALLGGHRPDAVGWFDKKENRFTGPAWADEAADWERRLQREWTPLIPEAVATRPSRRPATRPSSRPPSRGRPSPTWPSGRSTPSSSARTRSQTSSP
jgi:hypothetical protein